MTPTRTKKKSTKTEVTPAMTSLVEKMKKNQESITPDFKLAYALYREAREKFDDNQRTWMLAQFGKSHPDILMPEAPEGFWEPKKYSWEIAREKAKEAGEEEAPKRIVPKKKRSRQEINQHEVFVLAKEIEEAIGKESLSKSQIIDKLDEKPRASMWVKATHYLIENKKIEMTGTKKGAKYAAV